ncbi:MAG: protein translocase subunit SecDF [Bacteroidales bacterium]|nr:protein translocase subunit SecDF [Bacteroidales bacterium]
MRNKGAIILVAVLLSLICLYYLSFTWAASRVEKKADVYAQEQFKAMDLEVDKLEADKLLDSIHKSYLDSISGETVYNLFKKYTYRDVKEREINLGLDLKGGMNVTLEISASDIFLALTNNKSDSTLIKALHDAEKRQEESNQNYVVLFGESWEKYAGSRSLAELFITSENKDRISIQSSNEEVLQYLREEYESAISNASEVLLKRIDHFGVVQPNIQEDVAIRGRFHIELPGIKDPDRVRKLLQGTAQLGFWETYENQEVFGFLEQTNMILRQIYAPTDEIASDEDSVETDETKEDVEAETEPEALDFIPDDEDTDFIADDSIIESVAIDKEDTTNIEAELPGQSQQNPLFELLQPRISQDQQFLPGPSVGLAHFKDTAKINSFFELDQVKVIKPNDLEFAWTFKPVGESNDYYELIALKKSAKGGPVLTGDAISNARDEFGQSQASAEVSMSMNGSGSNEWARITRNNVGRSIAIVLDGYVYSYPTVQDEIKGGRSSITGNFSVAEAKDLANVLKSGKMPAPARIMSEEIVGPSLGQRAVNDGLNSFIIAFIFVLIFMIFYYGRAGVIANIALILNVFFIFGVLASFGAVLTLPGIAGIVLTIGMSVDANVLIFERIREETIAGKGIRLAIKDGYKNAYSAIIDANVTTLLTGIVLFNFGVGPIQGFATTLIIGIISSLFSAIFITRLVFEMMLNKDWKITFGNKLTNNAFQNLKIKFLEKRKIFYIVSGIFIVISLGSLFTRGLNPGIDFAGGRNFIVQFDKSVVPQDIAQDLSNIFGEPPIVKTFGADNQVKISTKFMIDERSQEADEIVDSLLYVGLLPTLGEDVSKDDFFANYRQSSQKVGPSIAEDIKSKSVVAIILSLIVIFLYILIRFRKWQYSLGAVVALVHDVLIILGVFSLFYTVMPFSMEIDQAFIAAILTVVGYSINDTVVVFDRLREYLGLYKKRERYIVINDALNSTISRTFITSLSTFLVLIAIFIFGGEVIRGFVFALLLGVIIGTYSSLFIATPIAYEMMKRKEKALPETNRKKR